MAIMAMAAARRFLLVSSPKAGASHDFSLQFVRTLTGGFRGKRATFSLSPFTLDSGEGLNDRQPWLIRGMRIATEAPVLQAANEDDDFSQERSAEYLVGTAQEELEEAELEEGELAQLPEELCESLETAAWSVGLDGLNVTDVPSNACVLGIDPDASGAIAVLRTLSQDTQAEVLDVPCVKVQIGKTMRRRHDASSIVDLVNKINAPEGSVAYVEQAMPFPKDGKQGWYGTGFGYGMWVGVLMALGFKVVPVRAQAWKSAMGIAGRQYTKDDSRTMAMALFPDLGPQLKRKKDHGRADALLIAAFGKGLSPPTKSPDHDDHDSKLPQ